MSKSPKCNCCKHLKVLNRGFNTRGDCYCEHPNQEYIKEFYKKHKIYRSHGFICYTVKYENTPKMKTSPKWCPKRMAGDGNV